jgi:repressor LexA
MTSRETEIFQFMLTFFLSHGYPPSIREIGKGLFITNNTIHRHLTNLTKKGFITHHPKVARGYVPIQSFIAV